MSTQSAVLSPATGQLRHFVDLEPESGDFLADALASLAQPAGGFPPKYFYDEEGSRLFDAICEQPEYYLTRTEIALLERLGPEIADLAGPEASVIEFGSGSSVKIRTLLNALDRPRAYIALDISREHLLNAASAIAVDYPHVEVSAVCADFTQVFDWPPEVKPRHGRALGFLPGSTIGNLIASEAVDLLKVKAKMLGEGGALLIGVDLLKDPTILENAYNDANGVGAAFNYNLFVRLQKELGAELDLDGFRHEARFNPVEGRIEMHLVAQGPQTIKLAGQCFSFSDGDSIHTENSHKYSVPGFQGLAREAGFEPVKVWTDKDELFALHWLTVRSTA